MADHSSAIIPTLQNIASTVYLDSGKLDLKAIALKARNAEYNPKRFPAVIMRIREPKTTALIFATGKIVCTGAKSEHDLKVAARKYARIIQKLGYPGVKFKDFKIQNIVASCDVGFPIRLGRDCISSPCFFELRTGDISWIDISYETTKHSVACFCFWESCHHWSQG